MATTPKTVRTYALDGTKKDFTIPFEYLARKFVVVTLIGATRRELTLNTDYRFTTSTQITINKAWGPGDNFDLIEIRRLTSATERLVDFADGSILRAYDLNISQVQSLHIAEEARDLTADTIGVNNDGDLDARARRIVNLADGVNDGDAVNMRQQRQWAGSALNQANRAKAEADKSANSATASANSAARAETQANGADAHRVAAEASANASKNSATASAVSAKASSDSSALAQAWAVRMDGMVGGGYSSQWWATESRKAADNSQRESTASKNSAATAATEANRSRTEADRAKTEADKLGNMNDFTSTIRSVNKSNKRVIWQDGYTLQSARLIVGDEGQAQNVTVAPYGLVGSQSISCTASIDVNIAASTRNINLDATSGLVTANTPALRVRSSNPILQLRSEAKVHANLSAAGNGSFVLQMYDADGARGSDMTFVHDGSLSIPGRFSSGGMTSGSDLRVNRHAVIDGNLVASGKYVEIQSMGPWTPYASTGAGSVTYVHGLGTVPSGFKLQLKCVVAEWGYGVGDILCVPLNFESAGRFRGVQLLNPDPNGVYVKVSADLMVIMDKVGSGVRPTTAGRWQFRLIATGPAQA